MLFAGSKSNWARVVAGLVHGVAHVFLLSVAVAFAAWLPLWLEKDLGIADVGDATLRFDLFAAILGALLAAWPGAMLVGLYLVVCDYAFGRYFRAPGTGVRGPADRGHEGLPGAARGRERPGDLPRRDLARRTEERDEAGPGRAAEAPWFELPDMRGSVHLIEKDPITV